MAQRRELDAARESVFVARSSVVEPLSGGRVRVVVGPRRAGKSSYAMRQVLADVRAWGYANFDDERLCRITDLDELVAALDGLYGSGSGVFFDEIQNLPEWELFINRLQRSGRQILLTGSNAHLLSSELATHLTGRHVQIPLLTFSFPELVSARGLQSRTEAEMREVCRSYARVGGFPEVVLKALSPQEYLRTLLESVIYKDIVLRFRPRAPQAIETIARCLLSQPGGEYSFHALTKATGCRSPHTLKKMIGWLEQAFVVFTVPRFSFKPREQAASNKKAYAVDTGFVDAMGSALSPNWGRLYENLVAIALFRRQLRGDLRFFYWKDPHGIEADFVIQEGLTVQQILQVCLDASDPKTRKREIRGLCKAARDLNCRNLVLLTEGEEGDSTETWEGATYPVRRLPVWKWLQEQEAAGVAAAMSG